MSTVTSLSDRVVQVKPSELVTLLDAAFAMRVPVLIKGAPGVGKTDVVEQAANRVGARLHQSHPAVEDPTVVAGMPWVDAKADRARFKPFGVTYEVIHATEFTVWDIEDLGQATSAVQAAYMQWLLARRCGEHVLPDCVTMVATTNRRTDRAGVTGILEPVKSRFATIVELVADIEEWAAWAMTHGDAQYRSIGLDGFPPELIAFLRTFPNKLHLFEPSADLTNSPSPRTWANAGKWLMKHLPATVEAAALAGAVGAGHSSELLAYAHLYRHLPSLDEFFKNPDSAPIPTDLSVLNATLTAIAYRTEPANVSVMCKIADRLWNGEREQFAVMLVRDAARRKPEIQPTTPFIRLTTGPMGALLVGNIK